MLMAGCSSDDTFEALGVSDDDDKQEASLVAGCRPDLFQDTIAKGVAVAAVGAEYSSSRLYFIDYATGCLRTILTGQSGDPMLAMVGQKLYFINRRGDDTNFLQLNIDGSQFALSDQVANPLPGLGDPADLVALDEQTVVLASRGQQSLGVMELSTGQLTQQLTTENFNTGQDSRFYPNALVAVDTSLGRMVYVLNSDYKTDGHEQLFVVKVDADQTLTPVDWQPQTSGIDGIPTLFNNPSQVLYQDSPHPLIVHFCTSYANADCQGGVEAFAPEQAFDPAAQPFAYTFAFQPFFEAQFDAVAAGDPELGTFYLRVSKKDESERRIVKVDPTNNNFRTIHEFSAKSEGESSMIYDAAADLLIVAEGYADSQGRLIFYRNDQRVGEMDLLGMPYTGVVVP
jgi:hypothetical protein